MENPIIDFINQTKTFYRTATVPINDFDYSQSELIKKIDAYNDNRYYDPLLAHDDVIGDYPFDNISKYRVLLEARATDFDTKHVEIEPVDSSREARVSAMIATKALQKKMREINFGSFINEVCITRPNYGGVLATKSKEGVHVVKWQNVLNDFQDVMGSPRIIQHFLTPSELQKKTGVWDNVKDALKTAQKFRNEDLTDKDQDDETSLGYIIEVFEIQGDFPRSFLKEAQALRDDVDYEPTEEDEYTFVPVKIIACGADWNTDFELDGKMVTQNHGIILYANEEETTHKYIARNPKAGRGLGEGVVESLFEHQKWHNFYRTEETRMIAVAGKKVYVTDDPEVLANIFDEGIDHGTVLRVSANKTITELNQIPTGTPVYGNIRQEIDESASRLTSSYSAKVGEEAKSGTPFRAQYLQNVEASSQFEQYREEMGIDFFTPIIKDWVLPDALKDASNLDEIYTTFTPQELQLIDDVIVEKEIAQKVIEKTLNREVIDQEYVDKLRIEAYGKLSKQGNKRTIKAIKEFIKKAGDKVIIRTTDESRNKAVFFESVANALQLLAPEDPRRNALIDRIMDSIGISKEELDLYSQPAPNNPNPNLKTKELSKTNQVGADLNNA